MPPTVPDLSDVTLVNESPEEGTPGDVSVFRTVREACAYLEPWWVEDREGFVLSATGDRLVLGTDGRTVEVVRREAHPDGLALVTAWLSRSAIAVQAARRDAGPPSTSIEDLIAYIGFQR